MMTRGILICHGELAGGLQSAAQKILGQQDHLFSFSNTGLAPKGLYERVLESLNGAEENMPTFFMVDVRGGSCWTVAKMLTREFPEAVVLSGVNLPMLISFLTKREQHDAETLIEVILEDAERGLVCD